MRLRPWLKLTSASFFMFFNQDDIFMARAVEDLRWSVPQQRLRTPAYKGLGGLHPRKA
jgi:hypothetical protein